MELQTVQNKIYEIKGYKIMLDFDLASVYQVETRTLKQASKRNINSFTSDFMFVIAEQEIDNLISQFVMPSKKYIGELAVCLYGTKCWNNEKIRRNPLQSNRL